MKPIFEELEKELGQKYMFTEFDVDKDQELTQQFKVTQLPTFIFIKNKIETERVVGEIGKDELKKILKNI
jgi:thioredoxin 1